MTGFGEIGQNVRFWAKMGFFGRKKISLPYPYYAATLCKKPEQTYERILIFKMYGRTHEQTNGGEFKGPNRLWRGTKKAQ